MHRVVGTGRVTKTSNNNNKKKKRKAAEGRADRQVHESKSGVYVKLGKVCEVHVPGQALGRATCTRGFFFSIQNNTDIVRERFHFFQFSYFEFFFFRVPMESYVALEH